MRAITVQQPWAWAIVYGGKRVENRGRRQPWHTAIGEVLAIHAGKTYDEDALEDVAVLAGDHPYTWEDKEYLDVRGAILGTAKLIDVHHASGCLGRCSPWAQLDQWHLVFAAVQPWARPVTLRGALGLWTVPEVPAKGESAAGDLP